MFPNKKYNMNHIPERAQLAIGGESKEQTSFFVNKIPCWGGKSQIKVFSSGRKHDDVLISNYFLIFLIDLTSCTFSFSGKQENSLSCPLFPFILYLLLRWYDYWMRHRLHSDWESVNSSKMAVHVVRYWYGINKEIARGGQHINV